MPETPKIEITHNEQTGWTVRQGDRYEDHMDKGEALYCVASLLLCPQTVPYLRTFEQHEAQRIAWSKPISESELLELPAPFDDPPPAAPPEGADAREEPF